MPPTNSNMPAMPNSESHFKFSKISTAGQPSSFANPYCSRIKPSTIRNTLRIRGAQIVPDNMAILRSSKRAPVKEAARLFALARRGPNGWHQDGPVGAASSNHHLRPISASALHGPAPANTK